MKLWRVCGRRKVRLLWMRYWRIGNEAFYIFGLDRVELVLRHLPFFGHDAAFSALLLVGQQLSAFNDFLDLKAEKTKPGSIRSALHAIALAVHMFVLPHEVVTALPDYWRLSVEVTNTIAAQIN